MRIAIITLGLVLAASAHAAPKGSGAGDAWRSHSSADEQDADAAARQGNTSVYIFDNDHLDGEVLTPAGEIIPYRRPAKSPSLIRLRAHFMPELVRMSTDL